MMQLANKINESTSRPVLYVSDEILSQKPGREVAARTFETRWHLSIQLAAERKGEEVIGDILSVMAPAQRGILSHQLKDELIHVRLFAGLSQKWGFDPRATRYADGYCSLVKKQPTNVVQEMNVICRESFKSDFLNALSDEFNITEDLALPRLTSLDVAVLKSVKETLATNLKCLHDIAALEPKRTLQ